MAGMGAKTAASVALCIGLFALLVAIPALVVSSLAESQNAKDDDGDIDYTKRSYVGHLDSTLNETFTAWAWMDSDGKVNIQTKDWNGTCISTGGAVLTSSFTLPDSFMPPFNATSNSRCVTPRILVETTATGHYAGSVGELCVNENQKLSFYRDVTNSTAAWAFGNVNCIIRSTMLSYLPYEITYN
jgi:hypothetical protein